MNNEQILQLERCALAAWPAEIAEAHGGWIFRFAHGVTGRANSVWAMEANGRFSPKSKIAAAEAFYASHGQPSRFQVNPHSQPSELADRLIARGYTPTRPTEVQTAEITALPAASAANSALYIRREEFLSSDWLAYYQSANAFGDHAAAVRAAIMRRVEEPAAFVSTWRDSRIVGVGLGVCAFDWLCISNMHVAPEARRAGVATAMLQELSSWALQQNVPRAFLQVMSSNTPALALYKMRGFQPQYTYRYFERP